MTQEERQGQGSSDVHAAVEEVLSRGWHRRDLARCSRRSKDLSPDALGLILVALGEPAPAARSRRGGGRGTDDGVPAPPSHAEQAGSSSRAERVAVRFLRSLPSLPELPEPAASGAGEGHQRVLEKVRALLAKAESTEFDEEAEAFTAKAQELMARHAIDDALLHAASKRGASGDPGVGGTRLPVDDPYASAKALLLQVVAKENRCRALWASDLGFSTVLGSASDLQTVEVLYTSLLVQAVAAMHRAGSHVDSRGRTRTRSFRSAFLTSFASRIGERLRLANEEATAAAVETSGAAFLPVLARREDAVERLTREMFPHVRTTRGSVANAAGWLAGRAAADAATLAAVTPIDRRSA